MDKMIRLLISIGLFGALASCGGGGTAPASQAQQMISGRVVDGYIRGATVFWDCNGNIQLDSGELSTVTGAQGSYVLAPAPSNNCELMALVPANAIDEDSPAGPIGYSYTMSAAPGLPTVISPLTTLVAGKLKAGDAKTVAEADGLVTTTFGLSGSVLVDYYQSSLSTRANDLVALAKLTARKLAELQAITPGSTQGAAAFAWIQTANSTPGFSDTYKIGIDPFMFETDPIARSMSAWSISPRSNLVVVRNKFDAKNEAILDQAAAALNNVQGGQWGVVDFWRLQADQMQPWVAAFDTTGLTQEQKDKIKGRQDARIAMFNAATAAYGSAITDDAGVLAFMKANPGKAADFGLALGGETVNLSIDAVSLANLGVTAVLRDKLVGLVAANKRLAQLNSMRSFLTDSNDCLAQTAAILGELEKPSPVLANIRTAIPTLFTSCQTFLPQVLKDAKLIKSKGRNKSELQALLATKQLLVVANDISSSAMASPADSFVVQHLKMLKQLAEIYKDILSIVAVPGSGLTMVSSAVDMVIQYLDAYITGTQIGDALSAHNTAVYQSAAQSYQDQVAKAYLTYYASWMEVIGDHFKVVDPASDTYVAGVAAVNGSVTLEVPWTLTVTGANLPVTAIVLVEGGTCGAATSASAVSLTVTCTVTGAAGQRRVSVLNKPATSGGTVISDVFTVRAMDVVCAPPQWGLHGQCMTPVVTALIPSEVTVGRSALFTVTGANLPTSSVLELEASMKCGTPINRTTTGFSVSCVGGSTPGPKTATVRTSTGGSVIDSVHTYALVADRTVQVLFDSFDGTGLNPTVWNWGSGASPKVAASELTLGAWEQPSSHQNVSGSEIVVEARMRGPGVSHSTWIGLFVNPGVGGVFGVEDSDRGLGLGAISPYGLADGTYYAAFGNPTQLYMEYRLRLRGNQVTIERGASLSTLSESYTVTLSVDTTGKSFYLALGTGDETFSPAVFDWIRVRVAP